MLLNGLISLIFTAAACFGSEQAPSPREHGWRRWLQLQSATVAARYRTITNSEGVRTANQAQHSEGVRGRLKLDPAGHYAVNFGTFSGSVITSSWNNTGAGTGAPSGTFSLKQLFIAGAPIPGIEIQYGSLYFARGEHTDITTYDNDAYLVGLRASIKRPAALFFDEVSATQGYVSPLSPPSVFDRGSHFSRANYWQALVSRHVGGSVKGSLDYTRALERDTVRAAVTVDANNTRLVESVRVEAYHRLASHGEKGATGFSVSAQRVFWKRATAGAGWADIDEHFGGLNSDRFNSGRRLFLTAAVDLTPDLAVQTFYTRAPSPAFRIGNRTRFEVIAVYNVLKALERTRVSSSSRQALALKNELMDHR